MAENLASVGTGGDQIQPENAPQGTVTSAMPRAAHLSGYARCGAGAGWSATKYPSLSSLLHTRPIEVGR